MYLIPLKYCFKIVNTVLCEFYINFLKSKIIPSFSPLVPLHCLSPRSQPSRCPESKGGGLSMPEASPEPRDGECTISGSGSLLLSWASLRASTRACERTRTALLRGGRPPASTNQDCLTHLHAGVPISLHGRMPPPVSPPTPSHTVSYVLTSTGYAHGRPAAGRVVPNLCTYTEARVDAHLRSPSLWHTWQCTQTCLLTVQHSRSMKKTNACVPGGHFPPNICLTTEACTNVCGCEHPVKPGYMIHG